MRDLNEKEIIELCDKKGMRCNIVNDIVMIDTNVSSWYFKLNTTQNIKLYHNNYSYVNRGLKFTNNYHIQKKKFDNHKSIIEYIYCHDKKFHNPKRTQLDKAFVRAKQKSKIK